MMKKQRWKWQKKKKKGKKREEKEGGKDEGWKEGRKREKERIKGVRGEIPKYNTNKNKFPVWTHDF
jgi:hypothetical protein